MLFAIRYVINNLNLVVFTDIFFVSITFKFEPATDIVYYDIMYIICTFTITIWQYILYTHH